MIESFTILSGIIAFLSVFAKWNINQRKIIFWMFLILLILFDGLRWQMGTDWQNYYDYFLKSDQYDQAGMEIGFKLYTSTIRFFTENYSVYLLITTALIYIGIFYPVFRITGYKFMPIFYLTGCIPWYSG